MFILGIICGFLITILVVLLDIYLWLKKATLIERIIKEVETKMPKTAVVIQPPTPSQDAFQAIIDRNDNLNEDTKLDDIFI